MKKHHHPSVAMIVALDEQNAIGSNGDLLCYLPDDLKHFKQVTSGHTVIMGRRTYASLPNGALPNRTNIVITSDRAEHYPGCIVARTIDEALTHCSEDKVVFVIGGGMLYRSTLPLAEKLYLTRIHHTFSHADTFFPVINLSEWRLTGEERHEADAKHRYPYSYLSYIKQNSPT